MPKRSGQVMPSRKMPSGTPSSSASGPASGHVYADGLRALRPVLLMVLGFSAIVNVLMLTGSVYMLQIYDRVLSSGSVETLVGLFIIVVVLFAFLGFFDFTRTRLLARGAVRLDQEAGAKTLDIWVRTGLPDAVNTTPRQALRDLAHMRGFLSSATVPAFFDLPFIPLYLGVLFLIHPWLGWICVAGAGVTALLALITRMATQKPVRETAALEAAERDFAEASRDNAEAITAMGMQQKITQRWSELHVKALVSGQKGSDPSEILSATSKAFRMLLQSAILTVGAFLVLQGHISGGMIIAASILSGRALAPIDQLIGQWRAIGQTAAAHRRLMAVFAAQPPAPARIELPAPTGRIEVNNITHLAPGRGTNRARLLSQVTFALEPGDGLGVIGNSASGKSTLARALIGAVAPNMGEVRIDGATLEQWDPARLGRHIGYLPQTLTLLPGTIRDNIARFDPEATDEDVIAAAELTGIHDMILALPEGYATQVGPAEEAVRLSGGQIQRIGLARAVFGMPALVVLDEPNSNLDVAGDSALIRAVETLRAAGSTVIVMAHRPSAIAAVDKLMVLEDGAIQHFGNKEDVLKLVIKSRAAGTAGGAGAEVRAGAQAGHLRSVDTAPSAPERRIA